MDLDTAVFSRIRQLLNHPTKLFPTKQPMSMERKFLKNVFSSQYVVSQKSDGNQGTLLLSNISTFGPICCLMNRREELTYYASSAPTEFFDGTLINGELVESSFIVFDAIAIKGKPILMENYQNRHNGAADACKQISITSITLNLKPYYEICDFFENFVSISKDDGLIFMPKNDPLTIALPYKWKEVHTVDLKVRFCNNTYSIIEPLGLANYSIETSNCLLCRAVKELLESSLTEFTTIIECRLENDVFVPVKFRYDKLLPNLYTTVMGTLRCITENITFNEIVHLFKFNNK